MTHRPPPPPPPRGHIAQKPSLGPRPVRPGLGDVFPHEVKERNLARILLGIMILLAAMGGGGYLISRGPGLASPETPGPTTSASSFAACGKPAPPSSTPTLLAQPPARVIRRGVDYAATVFTSCGDFRIDLLEDRAPVAVNNFVVLARGGFYDGLIWHQVNPDFIIQAGDPNGDNALPPNGPGYYIEDELPTSSQAYRYGAVGMANAGQPDTAGSQFFIVVHDYSGAVEGTGQPLEIRPKYTVFGRVLHRFYGSVETIARQRTIGAGEDRLEAARPIQPIYIERIEISEQ